MSSPRIITDQNGVVTNRKDYAAFGDETITAQRTNRTDYTAPSPTRKDYTGYEKDGESGLEYAQARYYNNQHGRFTSVDPLTASATIRDPQTFNRYSYALNSPYKFTDPLGLMASESGGWTVPGSRSKDCTKGCYINGEYIDADDFLPVQQAGESESPPCPRGHMCFGESDSPMSPSERFMAENFGGPGAYFSNPNDGDPVDQFLGYARNSPESRRDPENHLYPSATDPNAQSAFYVPDGGSYAGSTYTKDGNGETVHVVLIYFKKLGEMKDFTIINTLVEAMHFQCKTLVVLPPSLW